MQTTLAEQLLAKIMNWTSETLAEERFLVQLLSEIKYDSYHNYSQGMRFIESLSLWLNCFQQNDRQEIYQFFKNNIVFISEKQMRGLVEVSFPFYIAQIIREKVITLCAQQAISASKEREELYNLMIRKSLFLGLSDGSHIDKFRRANPNLSNEQISVYYDISQDRFRDMVGEMPSSQVFGNGLSNVFLLDDFSGSGISFIRKDKEQWKGKIAKLLDRLSDCCDDINRVDLHLLLYVSTSDALAYINTQLNDYRREKGVAAEYSASAIQIIDKPTYSVEILKLLSKYYDQYKMNEIEDSHYKRGNHESPYLGFNECSLPLVLFHNTPNNSLPIIWYCSDTYSGLFPRITRHKETGQ